MRTRFSEHLILSPSVSKNSLGRSANSGNTTPITLPKLHSSPSRSNKTDSLNYFSTKYEVGHTEETHEIDHSAPESLTKLTSYSGRRSGKWEIFSHELLRPDYREENYYRSPKIKEVLYKFLLYRDKLTTTKANEVRKIESTILELSESILSLYNINVNTVPILVADSHLQLFPINSRSELVKGLIALIPEICRFPYSFFTKLDFISISFCGTMIIMRSDSKKLIEKRLLNGLFPLGVFRTQEQIINHFYRILTYLMKGIEPQFDKKLTRVAKLTRSRTMLINATNFIVSESVKSKKNHENSINYQSKLLRSLITKHHSIIYNASDLICFKGSRLKNILESIDPDGMDVEFWNQLGAGEMSEALEFLESSN